MLRFIHSIFSCNWPLFILLFELFGFIGEGATIVVDLERDNENVEGDVKTPETKRFNTTTTNY